MRTFGSILETGLWDKSAFPGRDWCWLQILADLYWHLCVLEIDLRLSKLRQKPSHVKYKSTRHSVIVSIWYHKTEQNSSTTKRFAHGNQYVQEQWNPSTKCAWQNWSQHDPDRKVLRYFKVGMLSVVSFHLCVWEERRGDLWGVSFHLTERKHWKIQN